MMIRMQVPAPIMATAVAATIALACAPAYEASGQGTEHGISHRQERTMKIRMDVDGAAITATLDDNETSREFVSLFPLTLTLKDYAETEKISALPRKLSTEGAPPGSDPSIGDITYYAPWGNLAVFYKDFGYSQGLVKLGRIDFGVDALNRRGPLKVKFDLIEK
jgi:hypothetical protein